MSLSKRVQNRIKQKPKYWVFSAADFIDLGSRAAVERILSRISKAGDIDRLSRGLYKRPSFIALLNGKKAVASVPAIVAALAKKDGVIIVSSSGDATNSLGLTNLVQGTNIYFTTGKSRTLFIDGCTIKLKYMGGKLLKWVDSPALPAVQAILWLGKDVLGSNNALQSRLLSNISSQAKSDLLKNKLFLPAWAQEIVKVAPKLIKRDL